MTENRTAQNPPHNRKKSSPSKNVKQLQAQGSDTQSIDYQKNSEYDRQEMKKLTKPRKNTKNPPPRQKTSSPQKTINQLQGQRADMQPIDYQKKYQKNSEYEREVIKELVKARTNIPNQPRQKDTKNPNRHTTKLLERSKKSIVHSI